jgi:hypothetical protein
MKFNFLLKIAPIFLLFLFDFSFQNFNLIHFNLSKCSFYLYNPECASFFEFALNKILRLFLNLFTINLILKVFKINIQNKYYYFLGGLSMYVLDMFLCYTLHPLFTNWHKVLNPILYSPLAGIGLLAWFLSTKQNTKA